MQYIGITLIIGISGFLIDCSISRLIKLQKETNDFLNSIETELQDINRNTKN